VDADDMRTCSLVTGYGDGRQPIRCRTVPLAGRENDPRWREVPFRTGRARSPAVHQDPHADGRMPTRSGASHMLFGVRKVKSRRRVTVCGEEKKKKTKQRIRKDDEGVKGLTGKKAQVETAPNAARGAAGVDGRARPGDRSEFPRRVHPARGQTRGHAGMPPPQRPIHGAI